MPGVDDNVHSISQINVIHMCIILEVSYSVQFDLIKCMDTVLPSSYIDSYSAQKENEDAM